MAHTGTERTPTPTTKPNAKPRQHTILGVTVVATSAIEARAAASAKAEAVVKEAAVGPHILTFGNYLAVVWLDADGWQMQINQIGQGLHWYSRSAYGGEATIEAAMEAAFFALATANWTASVESDEAYVKLAMAKFPYGPSRCDAMSRRLAAHLAWQRRYNYARQCGLPDSRAHEISCDHTSGAEDLDLLLRTVWADAVKPLRTTPPGATTMLWGNFVTGATKTLRLDPAGADLAERIAREGMANILGKAA